MTQIEDIISLHNYIKKCTESITYYEEYPLKYDEEDNFKDEIHLYKCIKKLMKVLGRMSKKITSIDYNINKNWNKPNFFILYRNESETDCLKSNIKILEAFYIFIIMIIRNFLIFENYEGEENSSDSESIPDSRIPSFVINIEEEEENFQMEDKNSQLKEKSQLAKKSGEVFREKFMNTSKYNAFVIKFYQRKETNDVNKIPYNFINEFIYYSNFYFSKDLKEIFLFKIIDQFYERIKLIDFEEAFDKKQKEIERENKKIIENKNLYYNSNNKSKKQLNKINKKEPNKIEFINPYEEELRKMNLKNADKNLQNIYLFSFDNFSIFYQEKLRFIINRELEDDKENFFKIKSNNRIYKKYKRNNFFLSQKILNIYITFINNNLKEILKTFELTKCKM